MRLANLRVSRVARLIDTPLTHVAHFRVWLCGTPVRTHTHTVQYIYILLGHTETVVCIIMKHLPAGISARTQPNPSLKLPPTKVLLSAKLVARIANKAQRSFRSLPQWPAIGRAAHCVGTRGEISLACHVEFGRQRAQAARPIHLCLLF